VTEQAVDDSSPLQSGCIVVTGGASGIGRAVIDVVLKRQADVRIGALDIDGDALSAVHAEHPDRVDIAVCDVSDRATAAASVEQIAGGLPIVGLVTAAGKLHNRRS